jgi:hypothetical protein
MGWGVGQGRHAYGARRIHVRFYEKIACAHLFLRVVRALTCSCRKKERKKEQSARCVLLRVCSSSTVQRAQDAAERSRRDIVAAAVRPDLACGGLIVLAAATARNPRVHRTRTGR